jgi:hypothetical protein
MTERPEHESGLDQPAGDGGPDQPADLEPASASVAGRRPFGSLDPEVIKRIAQQSSRIPFDPAMLQRVSDIGLYRALLQTVVTRPLVDQWRAALDTATQPILRQVSDSITQVIATHSLAERIPDLSMLASPAPGVLGRPIAEQLEPYFSQIGQLHVDLQTILRPAALATAGQWAAQFRRADERRLRYRRALLDLEWWVPPSVPMHVFWEAGELADEGRKVALRQRMVQLGHSRFARQMVEGWMDIDVFADRRRFILDGLRDLRDGRYRVSIPTLLPLLEGIAADAFAPGTRRGIRGMLAASPLLRGLTGDALVETVTILYSDTDFSLTAAASRRLNRHSILHGRSVGYPTAANAVKVLFALDQLAATIERARSRRTS